MNPASRGDAIVPITSAAGASAHSRLAPELARELAMLDALAAASPQALHEQARQSAVEKHNLRRQQAEIQRNQIKIKEQIQALTEPERYAVVITRGLNGHAERMVEVGLAGGTRTLVNVHPDVPSHALQVGARGVVTRERNCLLEVNDDVHPWKEIGTYEERLPGAGRVLVRRRDEQIALVCAADLDADALEPGDRVGFDQTCGIAFEHVERPPRQDLFFESDLVADFSQVAGLDRQIARIRHCLDFTFAHPDIARRYRLPPKRGLLLWGPPGNGKTLIARCIAAYLRQQHEGLTCRFMSVVGSGDYSMWLGESERNLRDRFAAAREAAADGPVVMFFDELDAIGRQRHTDRGSAAPDRILATFLGLTDGVEGLENVLLIGASNRPDMLDPALVRPGRFSEKIHILAPNRAGAAAILRSKLHGLPLQDSAGADFVELIEPLLSRVYSPHGEFARLAEVKVSDGRRLTVGGRDVISGALLESVVEQACDAAAVRELRGGGSGLALRDLVQSLDRELRSLAATLSPANVKSYCEAIPADAVPVAVTAVLSGPGRSALTRQLQELP